MLGVFVFSVLLNMAMSGIVKIILIDFVSFKKNKRMFKDYFIIVQ
jgi:hypothetical protein